MRDFLGMVGSVSRNSYEREEKFIIMTKRKHFSRASYLNGQEPQPVEIVIEVEVVPTESKWSWEDYQRFYEREAVDLEDALFHALPQGTYDRLLGAMFKRKASFYRGVTGS